MSDTTEKGQEQDSREFLLAEYERLLDSFWRTEELGEKRVEFFVALNGAILGVFVLKEKGLPEHGTQNEVLLVFGLVALLLFGFITLVRIIHRNLKSHEYLRAAGRIRVFFARRDSSVSDHLYYAARDDRPVRKRKWKKKDLDSGTGDKGAEEEADVLDKLIGTGGLVETVIIINGLLISAICGLLSRSLDWSRTIPIVCIGFGAAWILQFSIVNRRYDRAEKEVKDESRFSGK
jgi:hypothetical protein